MADVQHDVIHDVELGRLNSASTFSNGNRGSLPNGGTIGPVKVKPTTAPLHEPQKLTVIKSGTRLVSKSFNHHYKLSIKEGLDISLQRYEVRHHNPG